MLYFRDRVPYYYWIGLRATLKTKNSNITSSPTPTWNTTTSSPTVTWNTTTSNPTLTWDTTSSTPIPTWTWDDGSPSRWRHWASGQPDENSTAACSGSRFSYTNYDYYGWYSLYCDDQRTYVCKTTAANIGKYTYKI